MKPNLFDRLETMEVKPDLSTFQSTYGFLKAAILTLTNTTDTSVSPATDPGFGKTPQALKMQALTQGMQTQFDRRMLEIATEKIFDRMIDLIAKRQEKPMKLYLKKADLDNVAEIAPDVVEMFDVGDMGQVTLKPTHISNADYRYEIDSGSTVKKDEILENQTLTEILGFVIKIPGAMESLAQGGSIPLGDKKLELGELIKRWVISSGITDWDKIIVDNEQGQNALNMENPQVAQAVGTAFNPQPQPQAGTPAGMPTGTPIATPQGQPQAGMPVQGPQGEFSDPRIAQAFAELQSIAGGARV
jgi:hypothetical protein